jgi:tripartite-type tricarboxylate transporter receptor subunit TctC
MVVNPSFPAKTLPEFIGYAKADPGKISMASAGTGSTPHVAGELFKMMAGVDMVHVPYRGGAPAITDLLGGQVQVFFGTTTALIGHIRVADSAGLQSQPQCALRRCPKSPPWTNSYQATRRATL